MKLGAIVNGVCVDCGEVFIAVVKHGRTRQRCDKHSRQSKAEIEMNNTKLIPCTGIAIIRRCLCCGNGFIARTQSALYCGLYCYARDHKRLPVMAARRENLKLGPAARRAQLERGARP